MGPKQKNAPPEIPGGIAGGALSTIAEGNTWTNYKSGPPAIPPKIPLEDGTKRKMPRQEFPEEFLAGHYQQSPKKILGPTKNDILV